MAKKKTVWKRTEEKLPRPYRSVLGWDSKRRYTICYWVDRNDCKPGEYWSVNGQSGGIGTKLQVKPPEFWAELPKQP